MIRESAAGTRARRGAVLATIGLIGLAPAALAAGTGSEAPLDRLIQKFNAGATERPGVQIDGWVERGPDGPAVVVAVAPRGGARLVADPGITVTPTERPGV